MYKTNWPAPVAASAGPDKQQGQDSISAIPEQVSLSVFPNTKAKEPCGKITLSAFFEEVRNGTHGKEIGMIRQLMAEGNESEANTRKERLKSVSLSGLVTSGGRAQAMQEGRFKHSGLLQIDIDGKDLGNTPPEKVRETLASDPHIACALISPRGTGAKAVMRIPLCESVEQHKACFRAAESYILQKYGWKIDGQTKDPCRLCLVSDDPEAKWNDKAKPLEVCFESVKVASKGEERGRYSSVNSIPISIPSIHSIPSIPKSSLAERIELAKKARAKLEANKDLFALFKRWVEPRFTASQGSRNAHLVHMVTFLSRAVGEKRVIELVTAFYEINQDVYSDPLEQHLYEAGEHLKNTLEVWQASLPEQEAAEILCLPQEYVEACRIFRDLASIEAANSPRGQFFMADDDLCNRLSLPKNSHARIFDGMISLKCMAMIQRGTQRKKGTQNQKGQVGRATSYAWHWSMPPAKELPEPPAEP